MDRRASEWLHHHDRELESGGVNRALLGTTLGPSRLALGTDEAGREIERPLAIVIVGGLVTVALLNLLVLQTLALRWGR